MALAFRSELNAGFAADGYARVSGRPAPLLLSTGPGALISLAALMEAASSHVPVVAISSQIPGDLVGQGRGYLHELPDQLASFAPIVKWARRAGSPGEIPELLAEAWRVSLTPPSGPVYLEIPVDYLTGDAGAAPVTNLDREPPRRCRPTRPRSKRSAAVLGDAENPVIWAGGGVLRSAAWDELLALAERLDAPVATTYMGKGALPEDHPLAAGSGCDEGALATLLEEADVVLCVGTELGAETTRQYAFRPRGTLVQIDADPRRIGATFPALGVVADAKAALAALLERVPARPPDAGAARAAAVRERIAQGLAERGELLELRLLATIREALPREAVHAWDMTILAYCAGPHFPALSPRRFLYPLGSGTLGYAWPAALGREAGRSRDARSRRRGRRRHSLRPDRARVCPPARDRRHAPRRRRRRLRHPARVPARLLRRDPLGRSRPAGLPRRRPGVRRGGPAHVARRARRRPRLGARAGGARDARAARPPRMDPADAVSRTQDRAG